MICAERFSSGHFAAAFAATAAQVADLEAFREKLIEWNQVMNLVGPSTLPAFWQRHALDSAQLFHVEHSASVWADVGTGAGFPGIVLAILLKTRPGARVHLIESVGKRVRFLDHVCESLSLPVQIHHSRAERLSPLPKLEVVTARACAPLSRLFSFTAHLMATGARGVFLKGSEVEKEIESARGRWKFNARTVPSLSESTGRILIVEGLAPRA